MLITAVVAAACTGGMDRPGGPLYRQVATAASELRPYRVRLSVSSGDQPCLSDDTASDVRAMRCVNGTIETRTLQVLSSIGAKIGRQLDAAPTADALWAGALLDVLTGDSRPETLTRAVGRLTEAAALDPDNRLLEHDLAATQAIRGSVGGDPGQIVEAAERLERLTQVDSLSPWLQFNRALVLELLELPGEASAGWQAFAGRPSGPWSTEAVVRARRLEGWNERDSAAGSAGLRLRAGQFAEQGLSSLARERPDLVRDAVFEISVGGWADRFRSGQPDSAAALLEAALSMARVAAVHGDSVLLAAVLGLSRVTECCRLAAAEAVASFVEGKVAFQRADYLRASNPLAKSVGLFDGLIARDSSLIAIAGWARVLLASGETYQGNYQAALQRTRLLIRDLEGRPFPSLRGHARWVESLAAGRAGDAPGSLEANEEALSAFRTAGDLLGQGAVTGLLVEAYAELGQDRAALTTALEAQRLLSRFPHSRYRHNALIGFGLTLEQEGRPFTAGLVYREALRQAPTTGRPKDVVEALARIGIADAAARRSSWFASLAKARAALGSVADSLMKDRLTADIGLAEGLASGDRAPAVGATRLDPVVAYYERLRFPGNLGPVLVDRGRLHLSAGDTAAAIEDLGRAAAFVGDRVVNQLSLPQQAVLRHARATLYRSMAEVSLAHGDSNQAYSYIERTRAAELGGSSALPVGGLPTLRERDVAVVYAVLPSKTAIWVVTRTKSALAVAPVTSDAIGQLVDRFANLIEQPDLARVRDSIGSVIWGRLLAPIARYLQPGGRLYMVVDGPLGRLSMAALRNPASGRYLIEDHSLTYLPSLAPSAAGNTTGPFSRVAVVDASEFSRRQSPELAPLPLAAKEAGEIAGIYRGSRLVRGDSVTREAAIRLLTAGGMVHFAGHARSVEGDPSSSWLLLSGRSESDRPVRLGGAEVMQLDLSRLRLLVLSACGTSRGKYGSGGGISSLAEAFRVAGAQAVVSSQWEVTDDAAADLMLRFHQGLRSGLDGASALQAAQVGLIRTGNQQAASPSRWASFRYQSRGLEKPA